MTRRGQRVFLVLVFVVALCASSLGIAASPDRAPSSSQDRSVAFPRSLFDNSAAPPDVNDFPALVSIVQSGGKLYYLGERSGMPGWFIVKDGQVQMIYLSADHKTVIMGALFTPEGQNVTGEQVRVLANTNKDIGALLDDAANQAQSITGGQGAADVTNINGQTGGLPSVPVSPGERLYKDMKDAAGVTLGSNPNAELLMIMNTDCMHCQETWRSSLRDAVKKGQVQVRLIPVADLGADSMRSGARLLSVANPMEAWDKYAGGDLKALDGQADDLHAKAVINNRAMIERWGIKATPYVVYRAKDGRVKIVQGEIKRMDTVLLDLLK